MARSHPPAWYPDPREPDRLRRWDGASWTADTRPLPPWLRSVELAPGPRPTARTDRSIVARRLWGASTISLLMALVSLLALSPSLSSPATISSDRVADPIFVAEAADACARAGERLGRSSINRGARMRILEQMVDQIRAIRAEEASAAKIGAWIADWDAWTAGYYRHSEAEAGGDVDRAERLEEDSRRVRAELHRFAYANGLTDCIF